MCEMSSDLLNAKDPKKKSGLLKMDVETKAVLEMAGKAQHSEGFREREALEHPI